MRIINAKRSTLTMKTSSGQILTVKPGEVSNPFIADKIVIRTLTTLAKPEEAGFVITNSFELDLVRQIPTASPYLYQSVETAKAALLEGKKFDDPSVGTNAEVLKLRHEIESLKAEIVKANELAEVYRNKAEDSSSNDKQAELDAKIDEIKELKDQVYNLNADNTELEKSNEDLKKEVQAGNDAIKELINVKNDLEEKIKNLESAKKDLEENLNESSKSSGQVDILLESNKSLQESLDSCQKENKDLHESVDKLTNELENTKKKLESSELLPEQKEAIENYSKVVQENEALKKDGAELMQRYEKAKSSVTEIMEKFNISYVDGKWQQVASM